LLQLLGHVVIAEGDDAGRGPARHHLLGQVRPREYPAWVVGHDVGNDFGHALERLLLDALGEADDRRPTGEEGPGLVENLAKAMGGHTHHHALSTVEGLFERWRALEF